MSVLVHEPWGILELTEICSCSEVWKTLAQKMNPPHPKTLASSEEVLI